MSSPTDNQKPAGLLREPLVHFLGIAALLFVAHALFSSDEREVITVDAATQQYLLQQQRDLLLRDLTAEEQQAIIDGFLEEEILTREARSRGFDNSSRIRALLVQNMRFFLSQNLAAPTEDDLRRHYEENPARFATTPSISYEHVIFADPAAVPGDTLQRLNAGADHEQMGERDSMAARPLLVRISRQDVASAFGPEVAPAVLAIDDDRWHGPFESGQGAHFLRIAERHPAVRADFEGVRGWIESDWQLTESRRRIDTALVEMRENYIIEIETLDETVE